MMKKIYSILTFLTMSMFMLLSTTSYSQAYDVRLTSQTFSSLTQTVSFLGTTPNANGDGTFTLIYYNGDLDGTGTNLENIGVTGETGPSIGNTLPTGQCSAVRDSVQITIPMANINAWAATGGSIDILLTATSAVNITLCSSTLAVDARLTYPVSTVPNDAGASTITPTIICPGSDTVKVQVNNYGTNQIDSVWLNWSKNGTLQTPIQVTTMLDTAGGTGSSNTVVSLGSHTFTAGATEIFKAWTSMPNGVVDTTVINDSVTANIKPSLSGTYTIGGASPDYATFALAIADLNAIGLCGPIVFNVRQGTYNEQVTVGSFAGSSSTNTVTFQSDPANTAMPLVQGSGTTTTNNYVLGFTAGAEYVTFDSLHFKTTGTTYSTVVNYLGGTDNITINNCMIEGNATATTSTWQTVLYQNGGLSHNNTITNNTFEGGSYGLYMRGTGTTSKGTGNNISNNSILNANYYQCYLYYQDSLTFNGNTVTQRPTSTSFCYGIYTYYCDDCNVTKNKVTLNTTSSNYGIMIGRWAGTQSEVSNNMFVSSANSTGTAYGIYDNYSLNVNIYHNSVNIRGGNPASTRALYVTGSTSTLYGNIDIRNNIFNNSLTGGYAIYVLSGASTTYLSNFNNNIYNGSGTNPLFFGSVYANFAAYQTGVARDSNSYFGMPGFLSQTDLHLQGALAADSGANLGIMTDIDGDARPLLPSTGYDIGADEYIPPTCPTGYGLTAFNLTDSSAEVTWTTGPSDTAWLFEYGAPGFTPGTGTTLYSSNDTATIGGLMPVTDYCVYVRGICGIGDTSAYFGPYCFKSRCVSSLSGTYTINSALPTGGTNYASFADVMNALNNCGISANTIFNVAQGTYTEQVSIGSIIGTSPTSTITFQADPANTAAATLTHSATTLADNYVVRFDGAEYITFDDITMTAGGSTYAYVLDFPAKAKGITVKNCELNGNTNGTTSFYSSVIYNAYNIGNSTEDVTIDSNQINNGSYAIYWRGENTSSREMNTKVRGNIINGFSYYGVYFYYTDSLTFDNNMMEQLSTATSFCYGIYTYYNNNTKVRGNKLELHNTTTNYGLMIGRYAGLDNEVSNNMIICSDNALATNTVYGIYVNYPLNTKIYHNSVNIRTGSPSFSRALYVLGSTSTLYGNVDIRNNIFANSAGGYASYITAGAATTFLSNLDYNIYFSSGSNVINYSNINYTSLAAYQTASMRDSNSYFSTPQYVAANDLHVVGAVAYDNGDSTLGIMTDFDGDVRPLTPSAGYDIGADEYVIPACPSPYGMSLDTVSTTAAQLSWTNGPADISWQIEYGAPGFALGSGTTVNSATNPLTVTGLTASTCYDVWIRSFCSAGDTSFWSGPFNFCTECAPIADYCTSFETDAAGSVPFCWKKFVSTTATNGYLETRTSTFASHTGSNYVYLYNGNDASATMMLIAPEVSNLSAGTHRANFWMRGYNDVVIGTMSDPTNPGTFTFWDTIRGLNTGSYTNYKVDFSTYSGLDTYVAFLYTPLTTYDYVYLDDYCWEQIPSCEKAPSVTVLNAGVDSTSINLGWNFDTTHVSYIINYGPAGYDPVTNPAGGATTTSTTNFVNVTGLNSLTEYCFWVKAICTNGDTSFWDGPHCGETGCPSAAPLPYFNDFSDYKFVSGVGEQLPLCWEEGTGLLGNGPSAVAMGTSLWTYDGFANVGGDGSAKMNVNYTRNAWFVSPTFDLGNSPGTPKYIEFDIAMTQAFNTTAGTIANDDTLAFLVSYNQGVSWSKANILELWDTGRTPSNTGDHIVHVLKGATGKAKFAFYGKSSISNNNNEFFIDNFSIKDTAFSSIDEVSFNNNFKVYPNPNNGVFTIMNEGSAHKSSVKLLDIQGRVVYDNQFYFTKNGRKQVEVNKLNSGVYILLLQSEGKLEQHRIVVE